MNKARWNNSATSREEQRRRKQQAVLTAGAKLFIEKGYKNTSLEDIANELNVTKRALYYYFDSKDEILFECQLQGLHFAERIIDRSLDQSVPVLTRIALLVEEYAEWVNSDFGACMVLVSDQLMAPERIQLVRAAKVRVDHRVRELIKEGIDTKTIRNCDPKLATAAIFGALNWVPFWNRYTDNYDIENLKTEFSTFVINGLKRQD